jgi:hypothetical protein
MYSVTAMKQSGREIFSSLAQFFFVWTVHATHRSSAIFLDKPWGFTYQLT